MRRSILFLVCLGMLFSGIDFYAQRKPKPNSTTSREITKTRIPPQNNTSRPSPVNSEVKPIHNKTVSPSKNNKPVRPPRTPSYTNNAASQRPDKTVTEVNNNYPEWPIRRHGIIHYHPGWEPYHESNIDIAYYKFPVIKSSSEYYYELIYVYFDGERFTNEKFPLELDKVKIEYVDNVWLEEEDFPEYIIKPAGEYLIYNIQCFIKVNKIDYYDSFAAQIKYSNGNSEIVIFNPDAEYLENGSSYFFQEEIALSRTGIAWLSLGYFDIDTGKFYSADLTQYNTGQRITIPIP